MGMWVIVFCEKDSSYSLIRESEVICDSETLRVGDKVAFFYGNTREQWEGIVKNVGYDQDYEDLSSKLQAYNRRRSRRADAAVTVSNQVVELTRRKRKDASDATTKAPKKQSVEKKQVVNAASSKPKDAAIYTDSDNEDHDDNARSASPCSSISSHVDSTQNHEPRRDIASLRAMKDLEETPLRKQADRRSVYGNGATSHCNPISQPSSEISGATTRSDKSTPTSRSSSKSDQGGSGPSDKPSSKGIRPVNQPIPSFGMDLFPLWQSEVARFRSSKEGENDSSERSNNRETPTQQVLDHSTEPDNAEEVEVAQSSASVNTPDKSTSGATVHYDSESDAEGTASSSRRKSAKDKKKKDKPTQPIPESFQNMFKRSKDDADVVEIKGPKISVYVSSEEMLDAKAASSASKYARNLMEGVFTQDALLNCTLSGGEYRLDGSLRRKPSLDKKAVETIIEAAYRRQKTKKWNPELPKSKIKESMRQKIIDFRRAMKKKNEKKDD